MLNIKLFLCVVVNKLSVYSTVGPLCFCFPMRSLADLYTCQEHNIGVRSTIFVNESVRNSIWEMETVNVEALLKDFQ